MSAILEENKSRTDKSINYIDNDDQNYHPFQTNWIYKLEFIVIKSLISLNILTIITIFKLKNWMISITHGIKFIILMNLSSILLILTIILNILKYLKQLVLGLQIISEVEKIDCLQLNELFWNDDNVKIGSSNDYQNININSSKVIIDRDTVKNNDNDHDIFNHSNINIEFSPSLDVTCSNLSHDIKLKNNHWWRKQPKSSNPTISTKFFDKDNFIKDSLFEEKISNFISNKNIEQDFNVEKNSDNYNESIISNCLEKIDIENNNNNNSSLNVDSKNNISNLYIDNKMDIDNNSKAIKSKYQKLKFILQSNNKNNNNNNDNETETEILSLNRSEN
ncbi:hypothetical protein WICMUC_002154 [Wickerhamomyces mucosus]|uniref:Uncharacterized protein n=1 Tax=Wickerhamomyces mucosus TaxID=1378264 RepID=A0A9P8TES7_9ASCO|nr:hypothetical protein WICMUC_002154 [Wickerhamomyces mucosus]